MGSILMLRYIYNNLLNDKQKIRLKQKYYETKKFISDNFYHYNIEKLKNVLLELGVNQGDTLLVHSSFNNFSGFQGIPQNIISCFIEILGKNGNLLMVSMPYMSSSYDYLQKGEIFNVSRTPSKMGLISEIFRRKRGVLRSLHPTHPVLAFGKDAAWIVDGHEKCVYPCGKNTPFDKFRSLKGKILCFDVPFNTFTFIHYIEDLIKSQLPFQLYSKEPMSAKVLDYNQNLITINTYVFSDVAVRSRNPDILEKHLLKKKMLKKTKIGKTTLMLVTAEDAIRCAYEMLDKNIYFYTGVNPHE
jgi:aminoglycoside 3-N-acetyltransferase